MCSPHFLNLLVGLLKQLLVHQLGLTEKSTQEDWPHFPRCRTASLGVQADSGTQNPENIKACHPVEAQMPFRTGTGEISTCYSPRTSTESSAPRDSVVLAFQESQASDILVMDHMIMTPEMPPSEPEGGLDESGEHFLMPVKHIVMIIHQKVMEQLKRKRRMLICASQASSFHI